MVSLPPPDTPVLTEGTSKYQLNNISIISSEVYSQGNVSFTQNVTLEIKMTIDGYRSVINQSVIKSL